LGGGGFFGLFGSSGPGQAGIVAGLFTGLFMGQILLCSAPTGQAKGLRNVREVMT
jgi:hypothetical protein